jgi:hypothetical protein
VSLEPVLVAGTWYERRTLGSREYVLIPGVAGTDVDTDPIPERIVRFAGYPQTMVVMIRQENRFLSTPGPEDRAGQDFVAGVTQWSLSVDGTLVYCPATPARTALLALIDAQNAIQRLALHPVRWQDPEDWHERACYYQGVPCHVARYSPHLGEVLLQAEPGHVFPPSWVDLEADSVPPEPPTETIADILYSPVWWDRERAFPAPAPPLPEAETHD